MADNFSQQADFYAKYRPRYPAAMYDFIFQNVPQMDTAWDCGTGSGQVASVLADHFKKVYASDISAGQLTHASEKENIKYAKVPAENTGFPDAMFDLITVAQAIHWFNFGRFYREVNRTAKKGALLAVIGYGIVRVNNALNPRIDQFYNDVFGRYFNENRTYVDEQYRTIPFPFEEIKSPDFRISYQWSIEQLEGYFNSWSAVQKIKDAQGINPVDDVIEKIRKEWPVRVSKKATFPVFLRVGKVNT